MVHKYGTPTPHGSLDRIDRALTRVGELIDDSYKTGTNRLTYHVGGSTVIVSNEDPTMQRWFFYSDGESHVDDLIKVRDALRPRKIKYPVFL